MEKEVILKKAVFGGYDCQQVMEYIALLREKACEIKSKKDEIRRLQSTVDELEFEIKTKDAALTRLKRELYSAEKGVAVPTTELVGGGEIDEILRSLDDISKSLFELYERVDGLRGEDRSVVTEPSASTDEGTIPSAEAMSEFLSIMGEKFKVNQE